MITDLILHNHPRMKTITLNDNHIAHLNAKNTTKLEYLNLSNNNLLPTNDIDQLISSKHLWHVLVNGINNDPLAQMQYWTAVRNIIDDTNEVTIDLSGLNLTTQPPGLQNFTSINLDNNQFTHFDDIAWQCHHYGGRFVFYACTFLSACSRAAQRPAVVLVLARRADGLRRFPALLAGDTSWLK